MTSETKRELLGINMRGMLSFKVGARHAPRHVYAWDRIIEVNVDNVIHPQKLLVALRYMALHYLRFTWHFIFSIITEHFYLD